MTTAPAPTAAAIAVSIARPEDAEDVEAYAAAHPAATAYHQPAILRVIRRAGRLATATFVARPSTPPLRGSAQGDRRILGILPVALTRSFLFGKYATSLPYFNYGGVLADDDAPETPGALVEAAWAWARSRGAKHLILRHTEDRTLDLPASRHKETLTLALPASGDPEALFKAIGSKTRNLVRKAEKAGLVASTEPAMDAVHAFHSVLSENMRDLGSPAHGEDFFRVLIEEVGPAVEIHLVRSGAEVAAAALTVRFRDRVEVPWASCLRRFNGSAANMALYWHMLAHATRTGARVFDFGRSTRDSGPYRFKLQWGARPEALPWYFVADGAASAPAGELAKENPKYALAIRMWQRLPVGLTRVLGAHLARQLP